MCRYFQVLWFSKVSTKRNPLILFVCFFSSLHLVVQTFHGAGFNSIKETKLSVFVLNLIIDKARFVNFETLHFFRFQECFDKKSIFVVSFWFFFLKLQSKHTRELAILLFREIWKQKKSSFRVRNLTCFIYNYVRRSVSRFSWQIKTPNA